MNSSHRCIDQLWTSLCQSPTTATWGLCLHHPLFFLASLWSCFLEQRLHFFFLPFAFQVLPAFPQAAGLGYLFWCWEADMNQSSADWLPRIMCLYVYSEHKVYCTYKWVVMSVEKLYQSIFEGQIVSGEIKSRWFLLFILEVLLQKMYWW